MLSTQMHLFEHTSDPILLRRPVCSHRASDDMADNWTRDAPEHVVRVL